MNGTGVFEWNDNKRYEGEFKNNKMHGRGVMFYPNGQSAKGIWEFGENATVDSIEKN